ncbi:glycoside hydrolase 3 [Pestalotiopsis sp. IQ-011]
MSWYFENDQKTSEDCLFLDVYVSGKAVRGEASDLPVLNWIYSGGYVFGSKHYLIYNSGMWLENTENNVVYVSANHRMGAFGFLNGPTVEQEATGNVGLLDQRATLQWIRDYIHLVGGDNEAVTAWDLSSGAGSIMHHLVAQGGQSDPLLQRAIMNSPALVPTYDNASMETSFQDFAGLLGCEGKGIACLRNMSEAALQNASAYTCINAPKGRFGFGPAIDHEYIFDLPGNELRKGNYWKDVSVLLSHVYREGYIFTDDEVKTDQDFQTYIQNNFPNMTESATQQFLDLYPATDQSTFDRLENVVSKWAVTCNVRWLAKAYQGSAWGYRFNVAPGFHGEDTLFNWFRAGLSVGGSYELDINFFSPSSTSVASITQAKIASFARSGDPNTFRPSKLADIPLTIVTETLNLLDITHSGVALVADEETPRDECDWWQTAAWTGVV